jgi:hypothetical protein
LVTAADVIGSLVWEESIRDIRIWKRSVWASANTSTLR